MSARITQHLSFLSSTTLLVVSIFQVFAWWATPVHAGNLQLALVRLDRLADSATTGGMVCAKPQTVGTEADIQVTFPASFGVNTTAANWTTTYSNLLSGSSSMPITGNVASAVSGQTVTFPLSSDLTVGTTYCFNFAATNTLTNNTAGNNQTGTITTRATGPSTIDSSSYAVSIISNDRVVVTASVPATFTFSLSANTDTFASNLSTTAQLSNGVTATIGTNAASGWVAWVKSANAALNSASTGASISTTGSVDDTPTALTGGNYGYLLDVTYTDSGTGTGTVSQAAGFGAEYNGNSSDSGGTLSTSFQPIASSSGTTDNDTVTLKALARITAVQAAAADYTDTLTVVAAGRF